MTGNKSDITDNEQNSVEQQSSCLAETKATEESCIVAASLLAAGTQLTFEYPLEEYQTLNIETDLDKVFSAFPERSAKYDKQYFLDNYVLSANKYLKNKKEKSIKTKFAQYLKNACESNLAQSLHTNHPLPATVSASDQSQGDSVFPDEKIIPATTCETNPDIKESVPDRGQPATPVFREAIALKKIPSGVPVNQLLRISDDKDEDDAEDIELLREKKLKAALKRKKLMGFWMVIGGIFLIILIVIFKYSGKNEIAKDIDPSQTPEMLKQLEQSKVSPDQLRRQKAKPSTEEDIKKLGDTPSSQQDPSQADHSTQKRQPVTGGGSSKNYESDKQIISKYENMNPTATGGEPAFTERKKPIPFTPGGSAGNMGGIHWVDAQPNTHKLTATISGDSVKAKLLLAIRSSDGSTIMAITQLDIEKLPEGSTCYGSGSFSNKRTYIKFNRCKTSNGEIAVNGRATTGRDPGIVSELIEITNNAGITFKTGIFDAAGRVLDTVVSNTTGGATSGIINNTTGDVKASNEAQKASFEYFVPANTTFNIYFE